MKGLQNEAEFASETRKAVLDIVKKLDGDLHSVLIIDDDLPFLEMIRAVLSENKFSTVICQNPVQALDIIRARQISLIFVDLKMPQMTGIDFLQRVRKEKATLPVVMITGYAQKGIIKQAIESGVTDFLVKPFDPERILGLAKRYCHEANP